MATGGKKMESKKRKRDDQKPKGGKNQVLGKVARKPGKAQEKGFNKEKHVVTKVEKKEPKSAKERRLASKEMTELRKKKRKPNYNLEKELALLWEKMRCHDVSKEDRSKFVSEALRKMGGKFMEIAGSHVSARVLQTCIKYCTQEEKDKVFDALRPHFLTLARKKYAVHLVKKLLDSASKKQFEWFVSSLHGQVASLLRHSVGAAVVEHVYHLAKGSQKRSLLVEMYSTELQLFKDLTKINSARLLDIIAMLGLQKSSVLQHMTLVIQPLLEKGIVDYSIVHTVILEYLTIADKTSATDVIRQLISQIEGSTNSDETEVTPNLPKKLKNKSKRLAQPLLVRMMHNRDGLKIAVLCVKHGTAKDRKKIIKSMKGHVRKLALDQYGSLLLICILSIVDDTKLVNKVIMQEIKKALNDLVHDKNGRRPLLQLLHPNCSRYLSPDDLASINYTVPSIISQGEELAETDVSTGEGQKASVEGKKDPSLRRSELLLDSGLGEGLIEICTENVGALLRSNFGREVIYEVAIGGADKILQPLSNKLHTLYEAIASLAAVPKGTDTKEEHVFENFHSSRTIRKLILDSPEFASVLWKVSLQGKTDVWAQGHSSKVLLAFLESTDSKTRDLAKSELQHLIDTGVLKEPGKN
ncbi:Pumilio [Rhynchospora pubera]|uniref:Pumilio n=1 Tax=Rhynchospora pubera TaxID=906938 RepID=A0AAV8HVB8_9POAL|nr:Pumilio [Rhynchospora pubera]